MARSPGLICPLIATLQLLSPVSDEGFKPKHFLVADEQAYIQQNIGFAPHFFPPEVI